MKKLIIVLIWGIISPLQAQWLHEIGLYLGGSNYSGDIGREMYIYPNQLAGSLIYKRNLNSRISLRATGSYLGIYDDDAYSSNVVRRHRDLHFRNELIEMAMGVEINYWDYDITRPNEGFSPYLFLEFGAFYYHTVTGGVEGNYIYSNKISYSIPFGLGVKTRLANRFSTTLELRAQYAFADDIDYNNDKIASLRFGNPDTNDWYFFTGVSINYSFGRPPCAVQPGY